ncbi:MAG TPA: phosphate ABC transporter substrate-binding protein PstS [Terriglobales bacterium]|nr:phosphate ABC transporter substrate-binding protein PstS [Terriglobales bacterium]
MRKSPFRVVAASALAVLLCLLVLPPASQAQTQIIGAGSTFVYPIMTHWIQAFQAKNPGVQINYQSIGSGGGIQQLRKGLVDFGASDVALTDEQLKEMPALVQVPESAGPVCITYNLPELSSPLTLTSEALTDIFLGKVTKWNDPAIVKSNPGVKLPDTAILVAHRSDGSGTTGIFTTFLSAVSPEWKQQVGAAISVKWPVGLGGKGSEGVTGVVKQMPGTIGYVELSYADENHLPVVLVGNKAGKFIAPSAASATAAIDAFRKELAKDVRTPIVNPPASAPDAYPISGLTFLLVPKSSNDPHKQEMTKKFIEYIVTDGQSFSTGLHYAMIPASISKLDHQLLAQVGSSNTQAMK